MNRPCRPSLAIPSTSPARNSPGPNSAAVQNGRPPLWTKSAQRKMSRLYVYTTLPLNKIIEVVHSGSAEAAPGKDSANKKLSNLFDKEPRWLHPRTESDMGRRVDQLCNSRVRTPRSPGHPFGRVHSVSEPPPVTGNAFGLGAEFGRSPANRGLPTLPQWSGSAPALPQTQMQAQYSPSPAGETPFSLVLPESSPTAAAIAASSDGAALERFVRQTSAMSTSSDNTSDTLQRILYDYPENYVRTVRRLLKRFTTHKEPTRRSTSPASDFGIGGPVSWVDDEDSPESFSEGPFPLPGDFLNMDMYMQQSPCLSAGEHHVNRWCMCFAQADISTSPWVYGQGLTGEAARILHNGTVTPTDAQIHDAFDNTVLHLLAARGRRDALCNALMSGGCNDILNKQNSAGQTFLHVLNLEWLRNPDSLFQLLGLLSTRNFDYYARDHYGRSFFHMLLAKDVDIQTMNQILGHFDARHYSKRDAFEVVPLSQAVADQYLDRASTQMMLDAPSPSRPLPMSNLEHVADPHVQKESRLLEYVRFSQQNPHLEDPDGRNGIHCLAAATLSKRSLLIKLGLCPGGSAERHQRSRSDPGNELDSSKDRLSLRLSQLRSLIDSGVDVNQYDLHGHTPLMAFVAELPEDDDYKTGPEIIELLLRSGANMHARSRAGETALHIAVRCGRKLAVRTLVRNGANVHARDAMGRSLLDVADVKTFASSEDDTRKYAHYEACRAWLSGQGRAVQSPSVLEEWGAVSPARADGRSA